MSVSVPHMYVPHISVPHTSVPHTSVPHISVPHISVPHISVPHTSVLHRQNYQVQKDYSLPILAAFHAHVPPFPMIWIEHVLKIHSWADS